MGGAGRARPRTHGRMAKAMSGFLDVLSIGRGHLRIDFSRDDPADVEKAKKMIGDMLQRGYTILLETPEGTRKVKKFDPRSDGTYIVDDGPGSSEPPKRRRAYKTKRVPMRGAKATAVGRTAGG